MPVTPYDRLAKTAWRGLLEPHRRCEVERSIDLAPLFADFWVWPGPPLPPWMGLFAHIVGTALVVGESETGHLTWNELRSTLLKVAMGQRQALDALCRPEDGQDAHEAFDVRGLVVAEHVSRKMLEKHLHRTSLENDRPGLWVYWDRNPVYIVSLDRLTFGGDTAVLHMLCRSEHTADAVAWLMEQPEPAAVGLGQRMYEEVERMLTKPVGEAERLEDRERLQGLLGDIQRRFVEKGLRRGLRKGYQRGRREGLRLGHTEGHREGLQKAAIGAWRRKFGEPPDWVGGRIEASRTPATLERLIEAIAVETDRKKLDRLVIELLPDSPGEA